MNLPNLAYGDPDPSTTILSKRWGPDANATINNLSVKPEALWLVTALPGHPGPAWQLEQTIDATSDYWKLCGAPLGRCERQMYRLR